jgi:hypothetical protein
VTRISLWLQARSDRERRLLGSTLAVGVLILTAQLGTAIIGDLTRARARVDAQERDLVMVRRLGHELARRRATAAPATGAPLVTRLEAVAAPVIGRERIASMTPMVGARDGVALRLVGTSLGEAVQILYDIEAHGDRIEKLDMVKHPDDPSRFDVTLEITSDAAS